MTVIRCHSMPKRLERGCKAGHRQTRIHLDLEERFLTGWPCQAVEVEKQLPLCRLLKECHNGIGGLSGCGVTTNKGVGLDSDRKR